MVVRPKPVGAVATEFRSSVWKCEFDVEPSGFAQQLRGDLPRHDVGAAHHCEHADAQREV